MIQFVLRWKAVLELDSLHIIFNLCIRFLPMRVTIQDGINGCVYHLVTLLQQSSYPMSLSRSRRSAHHHAKGMLEFKLIHLRWQLISRIDEMWIRDAILSREFEFPTTGV